jgi:hypothetical protein
VETQKLVALIVIIIGIIIFIIIITNTTATTSTSIGTGTITTATINTNVQASFLASCAPSACPPLHTHCCFDLLSGTTAPLLTKTTATAAAASRRAET